MGVFPMTLSPSQMHDDGCVGDELFDGVIVERRELLRVSLGAVATLAANPWQYAFAQQADETLLWDDLIIRVIPLAAQLVEKSGSADEEDYLSRLATMIERCSSMPRALFDLSQPIAIHESLRRLPILVHQFRLAPRAVIPYHDHRDYIGVLTVTEGAVDIRSFESLDADPRLLRHFRIRETHNITLTKGGQSTLARARDNIHELRAGPQGARFIDFFTLFEPNAYSAYLNVAEEPRNPVNRIFDASWA